jgi:hypothetical protein
MTQALTKQYVNVEAEVLARIFRETGNCSSGGVVIVADHGVAKRPEPLAVRVLFFMFSS